MFFIISKLAIGLMQPFNWVLFLFIFWLLAKNKKLKKRLGIAVIVLFVIFSNGYLSNEAMYAWQINKSGVVAGKQYEAGIILGGLAGYDKHDVGHFNTHCERFIQAIVLYRQGIIKKIIVSSGSASLFIKQPGEADFLVAEFIKAGIPAKDILIENKSRNTYENASLSKRIADSLHLGPPYVLITSAFHMRRSLLVFSKAGIPVVPYPCAFNAVEKNYSLLDFIWPSAEAIYGWGGLVKEIVGVVTYRITGKA